MPGLVFYEGPGRIDGRPIVAIATWGSENAKTGPLLQTWMLRADLHPIAAINSGADVSVCGLCPLRGRIETGGVQKNRGRSCYVVVDQAPGSIYRTWSGGGYELLQRMTEQQIEAVADAVEGFRYGSYGDPVAVPRRGWRGLENALESAWQKKGRKGRRVRRKRPGYTHQWRQKRFRGWATRLMASTHSLAENRAAHALGFRTFRTVNHVDELAPDEIICPASAEGGMRETCSTCGACDGRRGPGDRRKNVAIVAHGSPSKLPGIRRLISLPVVEEVLA